MSVQSLSTCIKSNVGVFLRHPVYYLKFEDQVFLSLVPTCPKNRKNRGNLKDIPTSGTLTTNGNTSSQKSQTVGDFYHVIRRIGIISTLKVLSQTSQTSAIFAMSVNLAVLRIAIVVRIPVSGNRKNP